MDNVRWLSDAMKQKREYQPYEVGRMEKAKRIKIARMLQESWKDENNVADVHVSIPPWYMGEHED